MLSLRSLSTCLLAASSLACTSRDAMHGDASSTSMGAAGSLQDVQAAGRGGTTPAITQAGGSGASGSSGSAGSVPPVGGTAGNATAGTTAAGVGGHEGGSGGGLAIAGTGGHGGAGTDAPDLGAPVFEKTRCIDPDAIETDREVNFPCDGVDLWVTLPEACKTKRCGLIFNIHGGGMTNHATMDEATNMIALGSRAGYVVVHPHKGTWSVANDRNAVFGFMEQVIAAFGIDPKRVHATGYSQGGQLSWALACEHADVVASVAPTEEINRVTDCWKTSKLPSREVPILFAYGKRDSIGGGYDAASELAAAVARGWQMTGPETVAGAEGAKYFRQRWTNAAGTVLEFISQDYTSTGVGGILAGHCLPMATGKTFVSCTTPVDYDWGQEVVTFFQAHPMP